MYIYIYIFAIYHSHDLTKTPGQAGWLFHLPAPGMEPSRTWRQPWAVWWASFCWDARAANGGNRELRTTSHGVFSDKVSLWFHCVLLIQAPFWMFLCSMIAHQSWKPINLYIWESLHLEPFLFSPIVGMMIQSDFHIFQGVETTY